MRQILRGMSDDEFAILGEDYLDGQNENVVIHIMKSKSTDWYTVKDVINQKPMGQYPCDKISRQTLNKRQEEGKKE